MHHRVRTAEVMMEVLDERSAPENIHDLHASAGCENWQLGIECGFHQGELKGVPSKIDVVASCQNCVAAISAGGHVSASAKDQAVQLELTEQMTNVEIISQQDTLCAKTLKRSAVLNGTDIERRRFIAREWRGYPDPGATHTSSVPDRASGAIPEPAALIVPR
jgi:hypothetical protein